MNKPEVFQQHLSTLQLHIPDTPSVFICPICMNIFPESDLYPDSDGQKPKLTDGHVWTKKYVERFVPRDTQEIALSQRVILCDPCNSSSGKNEGVLISLEDFRRVHQAGDYKAPHVRVISQHGSADIGWVGFRFNNRTNRSPVEFLRGPKGQPLCNPDIEAAYLELRQKQKCGEPLCYLVEDKWLTDKRWQKAQAALITSAYLQLFHRFGYTYVFNAKLNPLRKYIETSFNVSVSTQLDPSPERHISVGVCGHGHHNPEPKIAINPPNGNRIQILEVNFMDYHMRLPFSADYFEEPELCEDCGEETGDVNKHIILDAPDDEVVNAVRDKLEAYR